MEESKIDLEFFTSHRRGVVTELTIDCPAAELGRVMTAAASAWHTATVAVRWPGPAGGNAEIILRAAGFRLSEIARWAVDHLGESADGTPILTYTRSSAGWKVDAKHTIVITNGPCPLFQTVEEPLSM